MSLNENNCKLLLFSQRMENEVSLFIEDVEIEAALCVKYLGVHISSNMSWRIHINIKIGKAKQVYHQIKRNIPYSAPSKTKLILYNSCILSILLYGSEVYDADNTSFRKLERLQWKCLKWACGSLATSYSSILVYHHVFPICYRHQLKDLLFFNKLLNGELDMDPFDFVKYENENSGLRSASTLFFARLQKPQKNARIVHSLFVLSECRTFKQKIDVFAKPKHFKKIITKFFVNMEVFKIFFQDPVLGF